MAATSVKKVENKTARRGFLKWAKSRKGQQTLIILAFTIIPLVLLAAFTYVPFAEMVKFSFYKMKYSTPVDKRVFVGWKNYIEVFRNKDIQFKSKPSEDGIEYKSSCAVPCNDFEL